jgi:hypothetical protein
MCGSGVESLDQAIEDGWIPTFWDGEICHEIACPGCTETYLSLGEDGEIEVKPEYRGKLIYLEPESKDTLLVGIAVQYPLTPGSRN